MTDLHDRAIALLDAYRLREADATCCRALRGVVEPFQRANLLCTLAHIREAQWKFASARKLYRNVLDLLQRKRHVVLLRVKAWRGLGRMLRVQGDYPPAAVLLRFAVRRCETAEDCRIELADALGDLGVLYRYMGRLDASVELYQRALDLAVAQRGPRHASIAMFYHMLAGVNHLRGRLEEAEKQGWKSVKIRRAVLGPDHPDTAADAACLAAILIDRGGHDEAEAILKHALSVFRKTYGEPHYEIAISLHNLASIAYTKGHSNEALTLFRQSLKMKQTLLGNSHPDLVMTLNNLAVLEGRDGKSKQAERLARRAMEIATRHLDANHPSLALVRGNLERLGRH